MLTALLAGLIPAALIVLAMVAFVWLIPALRRGRVLQQAGLVSRKVKVFAAGLYGRQQQQEVASTLTDTDLLWVHYLPDHRNEAKAIVRNELNRRGYLDEDVRQWMPAAGAITVPPAYRTTLSHKAYLNLSRLRAVWSKAFRLILAAAFVILLVAGSVELSYSPPKGLDDAPWDEQRAFFGNEYVTDVYFASHRGFSIFFIGLYAVSVFAGMLFSRRSMRVLLLRPFGDRRMTKPLKKFVVKTLGTFGYVFTLSDRTYRPNLFLTLLLFLPIQGLDLFVLLFLTPLIHNSTRIATVKNERKYRRLQRFLLRRFRPSFISFLSEGQAFNIRCTEPWWKPCILTLMHSSEVIVVDLSSVKSGTDWELQQLRARGLLRKCVFVVADSYGHTGATLLERYFEGHDLPRVYAYNAAGTPLEYGAFLSKLIATVDVALTDQARGQRKVELPI